MPGITLQKKIALHEKKLARKVGSAINQFTMIKENDTVAVALSGGKDSYALLALLHQRLSYIPISYNIVAVHIDFGFNPLEVEHIQSFCAERSITCYIEKRTLPVDDPRGVSCFWCAWNRRKALFDFTREHNISILAFAHTMDDVIETLLLNMCYQSKMESMHPHTVFFDGALRVIRPLVFVQNAELVTYAQYKKFPIQHHACPFAMESERHRMRLIIRELTKNDDNSLQNMLHAWLKNQPLRIGKKGITYE